AKLANVALAAATVVVTYAIGSALGRPAVGLVGAAILALFPGWVLFAPLLLSESLFLLLSCVALWLFVRLDARSGGGAAAWLRRGVLLGVTSLVRGVGCFLLPVFASARLWEGASWRRTGRLALAGAAGIVVALVPWTVRNQLRLGAPILIA